MELEKKILEFVKQKNPKLEIAGLRGLVKSGEHEWSFRFTYMDDDFLSISKLFKITFEGLNKTPIFVKKKRVIKNTKTNLIKKHD